MSLQNGTYRNLSLNDLSLCVVTDTVTDDDELTIDHTFARRSACGNDIRQSGSSLFPEIDIINRELCLGGIVCELILEDAIELE